MSQKVFEMPLNEEAFIGIARYDTAHGRPHRDLVSPKGRLLQKDWLVELTFSDAANHAIQDFKDNHEAYIQQFKARHDSRS